MTGNFTPYEGESFAEEMLRMDGGAVAIVSSSRNAKGGLNEEMLKAFFDGLWGDIIPDFPAQDSPALRFAGSKRQGDVLNYAKLYISEVHGDPDDPFQNFGISQIMSESYNLHGDPTMELAKFPFYKGQIPQLKDNNPFGWR